MLTIVGHEDSWVLQILHPVPDFPCLLQDSHDISLISKLILQHRFIAIRTSAAPLRLPVKQKHVLYSLRFSRGKYARTQIFTDKIVAELPAMSSISYEFKISWGKIIVAMFWPAKFTKIFYLETFILWAIQSLLSGISSRYLHTNKNSPQMNPWCCLTSR